MIELLKTYKIGTQKYLTKLLFRFDIVFLGLLEIKVNDYIIVINNNINLLFQYLKSTKLNSNQS
jgi:hypothetical protein